MAKLTKYIIVTIAILIAELLSAYILLITAKYKSINTPYKSVMVQMMVAVITFYPTIILVDKYTKDWSKKYLKKMQKWTSNEVLGLLAGSALAFLLLMMAFVKVIYDRSMIEDIGIWIQESI